MISTRMRALQAGIDLVGKGGLRALTHHKVDDHAGLPRGSTSNAFRTRAALLHGVVAFIAEHDLQLVTPMFTPTSAAGLIDVLCGLIDVSTGPGWPLTTARLILFMEASHNAALRAPVVQAREAMEGSIRGAFAHLGAKEPGTAAATMMACAEGIILHRITRHDTSDACPAIALVVTAALA
ncbi:TetR family transcriptional regulator [Deinococcus sp. KSM4-11]|uniref:TetR/AcrR family transcriptional regulator n=1 Tax=Deinococcus sp. KSM4-11 TaxID=2568654 RepID=UPI0010A441D6|nr:TetR/AcrR family transcriptional regulator [Deinococcus sp. KSM4-11]THF85479.1 TetR family transcriptional regulator [Deinococcus sp. KSM4-11]